MVMGRGRRDSRFIGGFEATIKGFNSAGGPEDAAGMARQVARELNAVVAVTGPRDYISDGKRVLAVDNGHPMLTRVTGTGCMSTSVIAAFRAVAADRSAAAAGHSDLAVDKAGVIYLLTAGAGSTRVVALDGDSHVLSIYPVEEELAAVDLRGLAKLRGEKPALCIAGGLQYYFYSFKDGRLAERRYRTGIEGERREVLKIVCEEGWSTKWRGA